MSYQFFGTRERNGVNVSLPKAYRERVRWLPRIGDTFPDFQAATTHGPMKFHNWAEGNWILFAAHPAAFTPVCTTELADMALNAPDFDARGVKLLTLSRDGLDTKLAWAEDIERIFGAPVRFPMIADEFGMIAEICGMVHPKENERLTVRKSFLIDPSLKIRMIFEYPMRVGRSTDEVLRVIDALQTADENDVYTPGGWEPGDPCLLGTDMTDMQATRRYGGEWYRVRDYLRFIAFS